MQISGKVIGVQETVIVNEKFKKREIWIEVPDDKFPQTIAIEFAQDKCGLLDDIAINEDVTIEFNLRGRQWKDKVFNTISGWKITAANHGEGHARPAKKTEPVVTKETFSDAADDLPF